MKSSLHHTAPDSAPPITDLAYAALKRALASVNAASKNVVMSIVDKSNVASTISDKGEALAIDKNNGEVTVVENKEPFATVGNSRASPAGERK